jgi:hypothetical protein
MAQPRDRLPEADSEHEAREGVDRGERRSGPVLADNRARSAAWNTRALTISLNQSAIQTPRQRRR